MYASREYSGSASSRHVCVPTSGSFCSRRHCHVSGKLVPNAISASDPASAIVFRFGRHCFRQGLLRHRTPSCASFALTKPSTPLPTYKSPTYLEPCGKIPVSDSPQRLVQQMPDAARAVPPPIPARWGRRFAKNGMINCFQTKQLLAEASITNASCRYRPASNRLAPARAVRSSSVRAPAFPPTLWHKHSDGPHHCRPGTHLTMAGDTFGW